MKMLSSYLKFISLADLPSRRLQTVHMKNRNQIIHTKHNVNKSQVTGDKPVTCEYLQPSPSPEITERKIQPLIGAILAILTH